jgi:hypothetical protein
MSRGYGVVQRRVLDQLAEADGWVTLIDLAGGKNSRGWIDSSQVESTRRAVSTLAAAGVVETRMAKPVQWVRTHDPSRPGAVARTHVGVHGPRKGEVITTWWCPVTYLGQTQLHVRLKGCDE